jgi:DNA-directed RNA polymerase specialized sigma24 family protein
MLVGVWKFSSPRAPAKGRPVHASAGDLPAFNQHVQTHQARLYTIAYRVLGSQSAAEDATQAAVEQAYRLWRAAHPVRAEADLCACLVVALRRANLDQPPTSDGPLGHLPFNLRLPLVLIDVAGLEYELAADALHISLIELIQQLARAREALCQQPGPSARTSA